MKWNYMIVIHNKACGSIYNQYASTKEDLDIKLDELMKCEEVLHIWKIKPVNL